MTEVTPLPKPKRHVDARAIKRYRELHPYCEICGKPAMKTPHHIKTRASGGGDEWENLISLDLTCHSRVHGDAPFRRMVIARKKRETH